MRSYEAARTYFSILEFVSWCIIVLGGIVALGALVAIGQMSRSFGGSSMAGLAGLIPGAAVMFAGFMGLVLAQIGRAGVDSAEYGQQSLAVSREQLEISRQTLKQGAQSAEGFAALQAAREEITSGASYGSTDTKPSADKNLLDGQLNDEDGINGASRVIEYHGRKIGQFGRVFRLGQEVFMSLDAAKAAVDKAAAEAPGSQPDEPREPKPYDGQLGVNPNLKLGGVTRS